MRPASAGRFFAILIAVMNMDEYTLAIDRVERGLLEVIPMLEKANEEHRDDRITISVNALKLCVEILQGKV